MPLSPRDKALRAIPERTFQRDVEDLLTFFGYSWYHAPANKPGTNGFIQNIRAGFPDLCAWRGQRLIFAELKTETGRISPEQKLTLAALERTGVEVYLWRPRDMVRIRDILASGTRPTNPPIDNATNAD